MRPSCAAVMLLLRRRVPPAGVRRLDRARSAGASARCGPGGGWASACLRYCRVAWRHDGREHVGECLQGGHAVDGGPAVGAPAPVQDHAAASSSSCSISCSPSLAVALEVGAVPRHDRADPGAGARVERLAAGGAVPSSMQRPAVDAAGSRDGLGLAVRSWCRSAGSPSVSSSSKEDDGDPVVERADQLLGESRAAAGWTPSGTGSSPGRRRRRARASRSSREVCRVGAATVRWMRRGPSPRGRKALGVCS